MNPLRLQITDFMNIISADIDCTNFRKVLIVAKNYDNDKESNGLGKTTILSAIDYAIFGKVPTDTLDDVIRDGQKKCKVVYDFELGGDIYRIVRGRSTSKKSELQFKKLVDNKWSDEDQKTASETVADIAKLIKINHKAFTYVIKFDQEDFAGLVSNDDGDKRKSILKEPLNLAPYTKLYKFQEVLHKDIKKQIDVKETAVGLLGDPEAEINAAKSEQKFYTSVIDEKEGKAAKLQATLSQKRSEVKELKATLNTADSNVYDSISQLEQEEKSVKNSVKKSLENIQQNEEIINDNKQKQKELLDLSDKLKEQFDKLQESKVREKNIIEAELNKMSENELKGTQILSRLEAEYEQANKSLPNGDVCSLCQQAITPEHRKHFEDEINKVLIEKSENIKSTKIKLTKCKTKKQALSEELKQARTHEHEYMSVKQEMESASSQLELRTKHIEEAERRLITSTAEAEKLQTDHQGILSRLDSLKEAVKTSSVPELNQKILALSDEIVVFEKGENQLQQDITNAKSKKEVAEDRIKKGEENKNKLNTFKDDIKNLKGDLEVSQIVLNAFSPSGIPTAIIYSIIDNLQLEINYWLEKLRPELRIRFDSDMNMFFEVHGANRTFKQLSKGQKFYIALASKLGFARIIQRRVGIEIKFLELDEVDSPLDKAGIETFTDVVKKLENEFKIFVVTHNDSLKDKFSHAILVEGDVKNGSTAKVVTSW